MFAVLPSGCVSLVSEYLPGQGFGAILVVVCPLSTQIDTRA